MSDEELARIRSLVAAGRPIDAAIVGMLLDTVDHLKAVTHAPPGASSIGIDDEDTDELQYEPLHPVVRATVGVFKRQAGAPSTLEELRRNAWEERSEQLLRQN